MRVANATKPPPVTSSTSPTPNSISAPVPGVVVVAGSTPADVVVGLLVVTELLDDEDPGVPPVTVVVVGTVTVVESVTVVFCVEAVVDVVDVVLVVVLVVVTVEPGAVVVLVVVSVVDPGAVVVFDVVVPELVVEVAGVAHVLESWKSPPAALFSAPVPSASVLSPVMPLSSTTAFCNVAPPSASTTTPMKLPLLPCTNVVVSVEPPLNVAVKLVPLNANPWLPGITKCQ